MPAKTPTREHMPVCFFIALLTFFSACGLLSSDEDGGLLNVTTISAVEVALEVQAPKGSDITVERDGQARFSFRMHQTDTVLYEKNLEPATSYLWKAINHNISNSRTGIVERQATTLDTTSQAFTWQKFEFGQNSYSTIKDVAIIDENNIWAVGEIYMNDSTGNPEVTPYNVVHWNGVEWKTIRLKFNCRLYFPNCGPVTDLYADATSVIAFGANDIWITAGTVHHFDGNNWSQFAGIQGVGSSNAGWGSDSDNVWFVGNNGFLTHYNGSEWKKLESGTSLNINDIWGSKNSLTGKWEILAVAYSSFTSNSKYLLKIQKEETQSLPIEGLGPGMHAVWFEAGRRYFVGGNDLYQTLEPDKGWTINEQFQPGFVGSKVAVRGSGLNDIFVVGTYGLVMHFNGMGWKLYEDQLLSPFGSGSYTSLDVKRNIVAAGGAHNNKGIVLIGKRE